MNGGLVQRFLRCVPMKRFALFLLIACFSLGANARLVRTVSFDELRGEADLIVIATPVAVKEITEHDPLPGLEGNKLVKSSGIETTFKILTALKGGATLNNFILYHYSVTGPQANGPNLVSFNPDQKKTYLLFLRLAPDGRYITVSGQIDPDISVREIK